MALELERGAVPGSPVFTGGRQIIERQVGQLVRLVDDLLDASRITSGKLELRRSPAQLRPIIMAAADAVRPLATERRQQFFVTVPDEPVDLDCDSVRLTQVFLNLLNNAVKYTPAAGRIDLIAKRDADGVLIQVSDTGAGLQQGDHARIFEMFYQGPHDPSGTQHTGLGLGLALVKQLVELHGGSVDVRSPGLGQGSEFSVHLPALPHANNVDASAAAAAATRPSPRRKRILVIDDNRDAADSFVELLRAEGATAAAAYSGSEAVDALARHQPDVVFLDLGMPGVDGYQAARAIRSDPRGDDVVLIALTGWGGADVRRRTEEAGFDQHLVKPIAPAELFAVIASAGRTRTKAPRSDRKRPSIGS
jgi:CheY-like chemotaxis protein/two-component sensor histidine kinase